MTVERTNVITAHEVTIMPRTVHQPQPFGWIRLLSGNADAGYVYLESIGVPKDPHLGGNGTYIVTAMPFGMIDSLLRILREEPNLQIRYFDPQVADVGPSVFIEGVKRRGENNNPFDVWTEIAEDIENILRLQFIA